MPLFIEFASIHHINEVFAHTVSNGWCCGGCRGGDDCAETMVSVELAGAGAAGSSAHHAPNASASLGGDACAEAATREKCVMNECACATSESSCGADGGETLGQSRPTIEIAQGEKLLQTGARGVVRAE